MAETTLDQSLAPGGSHHLLSTLEGEWEGFTRTWFEPGKLADESPNRGRIRPILGGRFMLHEYEGSIESRPLAGIAIYAFNLDNGKFESAWADSFHMGTGIMFSGGERMEDGFGVLGSYGAPDGSERWGWRTEIEIAGADRIVITAYNISPAGEEAKAVETEYRRR